MRRWWESLGRGEQVALIGVLATLLVGLLGVIPSYFVFFRQSDPPASTAGYPTASASINTTTTTAAEGESTTTDSSPTTKSSTESTSAGAVAINWGTNANDYRNELGKKIHYICPPGGIPQAIWGTDSYTSGSSICTAAVHAGLITLGRGGRVTIRIREGLNDYVASTRHGITSRRYSSWPSSFEFVS